MHLDLKLAFKTILIAITLLFISMLAGAVLNLFLPAMLVGIILTATVTFYFYTHHFDLGGMKKTDVFGDELHDEWTLSPMHVPMPAIKLASQKRRAKKKKPKTLEAIPPAPAPPLPKLTLPVIPHEISIKIQNTLKRYKHWPKLKMPLWVSPKRKTRHIKVKKSMSINESSFLKWDKLLLKPKKRSKPYKRHHKPKHKRKRKKRTTKKK